MTTVLIAEGQESAEYQVLRVTPEKHRGSGIRVSRVLSVVLMWSMVVGLPFRMLAGGMASNQVLDVSIASVGARMLDLQTAKKEFLSAVSGASTGDTVRTEDLSPVLCFVIVKNQSADTTSIRSPVWDKFGYFAVQMEFLDDGRVYRRIRGGRNADEIIPWRLEGMPHYSRMRRLEPGESVAIPVSFHDYWPSELKHPYWAPSNMLIRALYCEYDPEDGRAIVEVSSRYVSLQTLLTDRISAYASKLIGDESHKVAEWCGTIRKGTSVDASAAPLDSPPDRTTRELRPR